MGEQQIEHTARLTYVGLEYGLMRHHFIRGLSAPLLEEALPHFVPGDNERLGWIDFHCDSALAQVVGAQGPLYIEGACGYPQTFGGNPKRLCGETFVAVSYWKDQYRFATAAELVAEPEQITGWATNWLRRAARIDQPHPPLLAGRSDEIRAVTAKIPPAPRVSRATRRMTKIMLQDIEEAMRRRGEII